MRPWSWWSEDNFQDLVPPRVSAVVHTMEKIHTEKRHRPAPQWPGWNPVFSSTVIHLGPFSFDPFLVFCCLCFKKRNVLLFLSFFLIEVLMILWEFGASLNIQLCSQWWLWTAAPSVFTSQVLGWQTSDSMPSLCDAGDQTKGFNMGRQIVYQLHYTSRLCLTEYFTTELRPAPLTSLDNVCLPCPSSVRTVLSRTPVSVTESWSSPILLTFTSFSSAGNNWQSVAVSCFYFLSGRHAKRFPFWWPYCWRSYHTADYKSQQKIRKVVELDLGWREGGAEPGFWRDKRVTFSKNCLGPFAISICE